MHNSQKGNVLFLILIAVALFAALSYAITSSSRSSGSSSINEEKATLIASEVTQYGTTMANAIMRMRLAQGCDDTNISFESTLSGYAYAHTPPVADKCKVFSPLGGKISITLPKNWSADQFDEWSLWATGSYNVTNIGTSAPDLLLTIYGMNEKVCDQINKKLGIAYNGLPPVEDIDVAAVEFAGIYTPVTENIGTDTNSPFKGQASGCFSDGGLYVYYHVLIPR